MGDILNNLGVSSSGKKPTPAPQTTAPSLTAATPMTDSLFGQTAAPQQATAANPYGDLPVPDLTAGMQPPTDMSATTPAPTTAPLPDNQYDSYNPNIPQDVANTVGTSDNPQAAATFQPHHVHGLGAIADFFLKGMLSRKVDEHNFERALDGFQQDPEAAIERVKTFNAPAAWRMQRQYLQEQSQMASSDKSKAATNVLIDKALLPQIGGLAMAVANEKDPTKQQALWDKARPRMLALGQQYTRDYSSMLPEKFDPDAISLAIGQSINPAKQEALQQGQAKVDQGQARVGLEQQRVDQQGRNVDSMVSTRDARVQQGQARVDMSKDKPAEAEQARVTAIARKHGLPTDPAEGYSTMSPDGNQGLKYHKGRWMKFQRGADGNLHPIGYL